MGLRIHVRFRQLNDYMTFNEHYNKGRSYLMLKDEFIDNHLALLTRSVNTYATCDTPVNSSAQLVEQDDDTQNTSSAQSSHIRDTQLVAAGYTAAVRAAPQTVAITRRQYVATHK